MKEVYKEAIKLGLESVKARVTLGSPGQKRAKKADEDSSEERQKEKKGNHKADKKDT